MMRKFIFIIFVVGLLPWGCSRKEDAVAYVGRRKITVNDFKDRIEDLPDYLAGFIATEGGKRQYLSGMIKEEVLIQKALDLKLHARPDVARRLADAKREVLLASVINYLQYEKVRVSDQDIRDYYETNKENFQNPVQIKISHILLNSEEKAVGILAKLKRGASFEKMAREDSIDTFTAMNGGDMGYIQRGEMSPEFEKEVFQLKRVGEISDVIKTNFGYHIVKLTGRRRGREKTFEEAKDEISSELEKRHLNQLLDEYRREYDVRVNYDILDGIEIKEQESEEEEDDENK